LVLAAGTGLGTALLISLKGSTGSEKFEVLPMEMGHVFASSLGISFHGSAEDRDLQEWLSMKVYNGEFLPENEDVCSGRGLQYVYEWVLKRYYPGVPTEGLTAQQIVQEASKEPPSPAAEKTLLIHYQYLLRAAQDLCIGLQAKGVILCGDNQVMNLHFVEKHIEALKEEFLHHPKSHWIKDVVVLTQTKTFNMNVYGCLFLARRLC